MQKEINKQLHCGRFNLSLKKPLLMGILNVTPDSFSDGGQYSIFEKAVLHAKSMCEQGVDIIDIGGESTRPGAAEVSTDEELNRVVPIIELLQNEIDVPISIDTSKATVMYEAVQAVIDPGFGFGKSLQHNLSLLNAIPEFVKSGYPVLVGLSRKSMLGQITGKPVAERLAGSIALATLAANKGAHIIRVHDVQETRDALDVVNALYD